MREIEVPADLHRFPPSVLGLCFPSVLLWKLDQNTWTLNDLREEIVKGPGILVQIPQ